MWDAWDAPAWRYPQTNYRHHPIHRKGVMGVGWHVVVGARGIAQSSSWQVANSKNFAAEATGVLLYKLAITESRMKMFSRRNFVWAGLIGLFASNEIRLVHAEQPSANDPVAIVTAIYTRAAKGKGDGGGGFVTGSKAAKAQYLSKSLIALWAKADAHTPKGDVGPVDFDPVTNSQEPDLKSFKVEAEKLEADKALIAVAITGRNKPPPKPADQVIRYDFVRDGSAWKIDDIKGASDGEPWSIRAMLTESLKN